MQNDWKQKLDPKAYAVLRQGQTELPGSGKLLHNQKTGIYLCGACQQPLFASQHKFDSGTGWPSFYDVIDRQAIITKDDYSHSLKRTEIICRSCHSHLGHVFADALNTPTKLRYCINSLALCFQQNLSQEKKVQ